MTRWITPLLLSLGLIACAGPPTEEPLEADPPANDTSPPVSDTDPEPDPTLWEQLGGSETVRVVLQAFLGQVAGDAEINWMFANTDLEALEDALHDLLCEAAGGACTYEGESMKDAHEGMAITDAQFDALVGDMLAALDELEVPYSAELDDSETIDPVLRLLLSMREDIVEDPDGDEVYFNQLGGFASVGAVVDELLVNVAADDRINGFFASTDLDNLNTLLVEQICEATGGFCVYSGRTMAESHAGLGITDADFDALVEDLLAALDTLGVPYSAELDGSELADPLLNTLSGMRADIVEG